MSSRKRMSFGGMRGKSSPIEGGSGGARETGRSSGKSSRRSSLSSWAAVGISGALNTVKTSIQTASAAADRFERRLFSEYGDDEGIEFNGDADAYGMLCAQRGQGQRADFESRYRHLVETLGDLSLAADVDPEGAAADLDDSRATEDLTAMLALLRAEERQNSRAEHSRSSMRSGLGVDGSNDPDGDLLAAPCLEFLLEERVVNVLCEMGTADRPAGTLALVLGAMASLLGQVAHPLLPSQAVHDPISKLVAAAGAHGRRFEGAGGSGGRAGQGRQQQTTARSGRSSQRLLSSSRSANAAAAAAQARARARVQANLSRLLGAIWRKLREESALIDFFLRLDSSNSSDQLGATAAAGSASGSLHLDVFDGLLPLLELPGRAGQQAREACLVALSVKDARVGRYVADRTDICSQLVQTLTARYMALYDTLEELEVAAALPVAGVDGSGTEESGAGGVAGLLTLQQPERAEATFTEALSLFLQHLRFCNAVGLVAADTQACLRAPTASSSLSSGGGGGGGVVAETAGGSSTSKPVSSSGDTGTAMCDANAVVAAGLHGGGDGGGGVAMMLASQVRHLLLGNAIGPGLTSALESRARWTTTIAARTITEISAGAEGYGVAVAGLFFYSVGEGNGGRRQLGPLVDTVSAFLVGREGSGSSSSSSSSRRSGDIMSTTTSAVAKVAVEAAAPTPSSSAVRPGPDSGSMVLMTSRKSSNVCLRDVLLRRLGPSSPSQLRVSTLELLVSLAELRDDRVFLDLVLSPEADADAGAGAAVEKAPPSSNKTAAQGGEGGKAERRREAQCQPTNKNEEETGCSRESKSSSSNNVVEALLDASPGGPLEGVRVSRAMVDSFGSAFGGSPIHPNFRLFSASSQPSLEGYLVAAHQRQIHQLMEGGRGSYRGGQRGKKEDRDGAGEVDADMLDIVVGSDRGKVLQAVAAVAEAVGVEEDRGIAAAVMAGAAPARERAATAAASSLSSARGPPAVGGREEVLEFDSAGFVREHGHELARAVDTEGSFLHALFDCLEAVFERTLEENLAVTGVLSSLCLAATAAEVSPVRRLLLVLLFDGTQDAPFRSMRRILETLWGPAQERVASLPDAARLLAQARASLGMPSAGDPATMEDSGGVAGVTTGVGGGERGRQGSRGMREELSNSKRRQQQQQQQPGVSRTDGGVGGGRGEAAAARGGEDVRKVGEGKDVGSFSQQQQQRQRSSSSSSSSRFLGTYVFLEEFLKELFCALSAKNGVETDARGLSESHRRGSAELCHARVLSIDGDISPKPAPRAVHGADGLRDGGGEEGEEEEEEVGDLPTSLVEFLREAAFPTFVSPSSSC